MFVIQKNHRCIHCLLAVLLVLLVWLDLSFGSRYISLIDALRVDGIDQRILLGIRLPKTLTAIFAGAALSISGLMMQTLFRNPLAGPYILGISSGAGLGVALCTLTGSLLGIGVLTGTLSLAMAAMIGATLVLLLVVSVARRVRDNVTLLIVGMMIGSVASAVVNLLQNFANPDALKLFIVWTFGSLMSVGWSELVVLAVLAVVATAMIIGLLKPLDGLLMGENYARGLGIPVERVRLFIILTTSLLSGSVTAFCGPIAFIGVAVPHMARGLYQTSNHRSLIPAVALLGADTLLVCDVVTSLSHNPLPISSLSALIGAPIILSVILRKR